MTGRARCSLVSGWNVLVTVLPWWGDVRPYGALLDTSHADYLMDIVPMRIIWHIRMQGPTISYLL